MAKSLPMQTCSNNESVRTDASSEMNQLVLHVYTMLLPTISTGKFANEH